MNHAELGVDTLKVLGQLVMSGRVVRVNEWMFI